MPGDFEKLVKEFTDKGYEGIHLQEAVYGAAYVMAIFTGDVKAMAHFKKKWTETVKKSPWKANKYLKNV